MNPLKSIFIFTGNEAMPISRFPLLPIMYLAAWAGKLTYLTLKSTGTPNGSSGPQLAHASNEFKKKEKAKPMVNSSLDIGIRNNDQHYQVLVVIFSSPN